MKRFRYCVVVVVVFCVVAFLSSEFVSTQGFDSLLELPRNGSDKYRPESKWVLSVDDYGARGDAIHDDSQVCVRVCVINGMCMCIFLVDCFSGCGLSHKILVLLNYYINFIICKPFCVWFSQNCQIDTDNLVRNSLLVDNIFIKNFGI